MIAKQLSKFDVVNIGSVGTFAVRGEVSEPVLRRALVRNIPFKCEIIICPAHEILKLASKDPFSKQPSEPHIVQFVSVLARPVRPWPALPLSLPSGADWVVKVLAIQDRFAFGLYRRQMRAISYLSQIEKRLGVPVTTRSWSTIDKVAKALS